MALSTFAHNFTSTTPILSSQSWLFAEFLPLEYRFYIHERRNSTSKTKNHNISKKRETSSHPYSFQEDTLLPFENILHKVFFHQPIFASRNAISLTPPSGIEKIDFSILILQRITVATSPLPSENISAEATTC